ncbi:MAG: PH domain-containing protein [Verrucomicrobia bacterium]|nr:PH domain-containing protein [Verrucomicrobiota bacterium]
MPAAFDEKAILAIERPSPQLMLYYFLRSLLTGPVFPIAILPYYFKYHTLRYRFDQEGISMRWGILFRREVILNYARIQDIHLTSNLIERWLGLARVQIQTASGSASAEMTIEGLRQFEAVRDFLYSKMRGHKSPGGEFPLRMGDPSSAAPAAALSPAVGNAAELALVLKEVASELRAIRLALEASASKPGSPSDA